MDFRFLCKIPWFKPQIACEDQDQKCLSVNNHLGTAGNLASTVVEPKNHIEVNLWRWSVASIYPLVANARDNIPWLKSSQAKCEDGSVNFQLVCDDSRMDANLKSSVIEQPEKKPLFDIKFPVLSMCSITPAVANWRFSLPWVTDQVCEEQQNQNSRFVNDDSEISGKFASTIIDRQKWKPRLEMNLWGWSINLIVPWNVDARNASHKASTINTELKRHARVNGAVETCGGARVPLRFRPYVSKVPWHTGSRAFLSQFFPRYGHYCGPNWSSGKNGGSPIWDQRPIDWLDFCCYCHDIGYDTHDQATLLKADLAFLDCLEKPNMSIKGDFQVAHLYKTMCITGLRNILIPYRKRMLQLQSGQPSINFSWLSNISWKNWNPQKS